VKIERKKEFVDELRNIISFIALDSEGRAKKFKHELDSKIEDTIHFPYKYRQSFHHSSKDIRDLIFKGYTVVYRVNKQKDRVEILEIFKWTK